MKKLLLLILMPLLVVGQETHQTNINLETVNIYGSMLDFKNNVESGKNITIINFAVTSKISFTQFLLMNY